MAQRYRVIVVGCGAIGAASAYWLSRRLGRDVLVLEQYELGHRRGASEDHSRVIRHAYSRPEYTALTPATYQSWGVAEQATGLRLVHRTGGLFFATAGAEGSAQLTNTAAAMAAQNLVYEELTAAEVRRRWPQWRLGEQDWALHDVEAGFLDIRQGTAAHVALARDHGAVVVQHAPVKTIEETPAGVEIEAAGDRYVADRVVLAGGAWNPLLLRMIGADLSISLSEEQVTYFATTKVRDFMPDRFPVWGFLDDGLNYYGIPVHGEVAIKAGIDAGGPIVTPETRRYEADPDRVRRVREFLERRLPDGVGPELHTRVCCYDFPPDRHFIADHVPGHERFVVCAGAGHAGKFAALLGRVLSELTLDGQTQFPVDAFRADRPAITGAAVAQLAPANSF